LKTKGKGKKYEALAKVLNKIRLIAKDETLSCRERELALCKIFNISQIVLNEEGLI